MGAKSGSGDGGAVPPADAVGAQGRDGRGSRESRVASDCVAEAVVLGGAVGHVSSKLCRKRAGWEQICLETCVREWVCTQYVFA